MMTNAGSSFRFPFNRYIRSHMPLDDLERMARFPPVDRWGNELPKAKRRKIRHQAGAHGE